VTLQRVFFDTQEVEDNLLSCGKLWDQIEDEEEKAEEQDTVHDVHDKKKVDYVISFLEECHESEHKQGADLNFDPLHYEKRVDYAPFFFKVFNDDAFAEDTDQLVEEQVVVPNFLANDISEGFDLPIYDEYDVDFVEQPTVCFSLENDSFQ